MAMSKKDYVAIAGAISETMMLSKTYPIGQDDAIRHATRAQAERIADVMAQDNPRFNRARFLAACGVSS